MFYRSKIEKKLIMRIYGIFLIIILTHPMRIWSQTDESISKFLLNESELVGYKLISQFRNDWIIGEDNQLQKSIRQTWIPDGIDKDKEINVDICVFNSLPEALRGTAYNSGSYETLFLWGSNNGAILGDCSWIDANGGSTMILVRGNVSAHIGFPIAKGDQRRELEAIAYRILTKIEENLSQEILFVERVMREKRGSFLQEYQKITDPILYSETMNGFSLHSTGDSKWLIESEIVMGIRKEWKDERGSLVGIDICKFDSDSIGVKAATSRSRMTYSSVFNIDNLDSLKSILFKWKNTWKYGLSKNLFSMVMLRENIAVHIYHFSPTEIDTNFFFSIVEKLSMHVSNR